MGNACCCGCLVETAVDTYKGVSAILPWLHLPDGKTLRSDGVLIVQVLRDASLFPNPPVVTIEGDQYSHPLYNIAGDKKDVPFKMQTSAGVKTGNEKAGANNKAQHSYFMLVLVKDLM